MKSGRKSIRKNLENKIRMKTIGRKIHRIRSEKCKQIDDGKLQNSELEEKSMNLGAKMKTEINDGKLPNLEFMTK